MTFNVIQVFFIENRIKMFKNNKIKGMFVAMVFVAILLGGCNFKDYECDTAFEKFLLENGSKYEDLTRKEWIALPDSIRQYAYATMSATAKYNFWIDKLEETLNADNWTDDELSHINNLIDFIKSNSYIFDKGYSDSLTATTVTNYANYWINYASASLGWTYSVQYAIAGTGLGYTEVTNDLSDLGQGGFPYCNCNTSSNWGVCQLRGRTCGTNGKCWSTPYTGCGFIMFFPCDGYCVK